ncbi:MAG: glycosyltransferase [Acidobacteriota bacterium]|nr:glycosyltransferase [Acidobacteriota bacterium]
MRRLGIVVPTHNRAASLRRTLASVVEQSYAGTRPEIVVVNNNSTDATAAVCAEFAPAVRVLDEPRQGLSYARNTGIASFEHFDQDDVIAFIDDDIEARPDWAAALAAAFTDDASIECVGGRVLASDPTALPAWLTPEHWGPLALQDHGSSRRTFSESSPVGLIGANFAFRKRVFKRIGGFSPDVQRIRDGVGSTEDHEFLRRLYATGATALYVPDAVVTTEVPAERMTREYHRRWHRGHGRFHALMRLPEMERARARLLGIPMHLFRRAMQDVVSWVRSLLKGDAARAFAAETRLWFFSGFVKERCVCLGRR